MRPQLLLPLFLPFGLIGQINTITLDQNNTSAIISNKGTFFHDFNGAASGYEVPKFSGNNAIHSTRFWLGAKESNGTLHTVTGGLPGIGTDVFKGPYSSTNAYNDPYYTQSWNISLWDICQEDIDIFRLNWECANGITTVGCATAPPLTSEIIGKINNWPAHGDISLGQEYFLAPFYDWNGDGAYNPVDGDYPIIKGCCATYMIQNDLAANHTASNTPPIGVEIHYIMYQYATWNYLNDITFIDVLTINKGPNNYSEFATGLVMDADIGNYADDYFASYPQGDLMLFYNADNYDDNAYLDNPPAIGVVSLENSLTSVTPFSSPANANEVWNLLDGKKPNGTAWQDPNGSATSFVFSGDPSGSVVWNETTAGNSPGDRYGIMSTKYNGLNSGDSIFESYAILYSRNGDHLFNAQSIIALSDDVKAFYISEADIPCEGNYWGLEEKKQLNYSVYPNPSNGIFTVRTELTGKIDLTVSDLSGRRVNTQILESTEDIQIDLSSCENGVYFIEILGKTEGIRFQVIKK